MRRAIAVLLIFGAASMLVAAQESPHPLKDVKQVRILPTAINDPRKVKSPDAVARVERALRRAVLVNELQIDESAPVKLRVSLDEFTGGSTAARVIVGFGVGRSTVDCHLQLFGPDDQEIANVRVRERGELAWSSYEGDTAQTKEALNKFERHLADIIEKWE